MVLRDDFLTDSFLADDEQPPPLLGARHAHRGGSLTPNWDAGGGYAADVPALGSSSTGRAPSRCSTATTKHGNPDPAHNPLTGKHDIKFTAKKLSYRTPTLVSIHWATALLPAQQLGPELFNADPSLAGRMAAYEDGMTKLLWPDRRLGARSMLVTTQDSKLPDFLPMLMKQMPEFLGLARPGP